MELYILDETYARQTLIDSYESAIWTERFKGDGDFQLVIPSSNSDLIRLLPTNTIMECEGSEEPMIVEELDIEDGKCTVSGIAIPKWLNNRFIRSSPSHQVREWLVDDQPIGAIMTTIVQNWAIASSYLTNHPEAPPFPADTMGIKDVEWLKIPGLFISGYATHDSTGALIDSFTGAIPFGPM